MKHPLLDTPDEQLNAFAAEQKKELLAFLEEEPDLPAGLSHGIWQVERQYVCGRCGVGYLGRAQAESHLGAHPFAPPPAETVEPEPVVEEPKEPAPKKPTRKASDTEAEGTA